MATALSQTLSRHSLEDEELAETVYLCILQDHSFREHLTSAGLGTMVEVAGDKEDFIWATLESIKISPAGREDFKAMLEHCSSDN